MNRRYTFSIEDRTVIRMIGRRSTEHEKTKRKMKCALSEFCVAFQGCLPFTRRNRFVNICEKMPKGKCHTYREFDVIIFPNGKHILPFSVGNFGVPFKTFRLLISRMFRSESSQNCPNIYILTENSGTTQEPSI